MSDPLADLLGGAEAECSNDRILLQARFDDSLSIAKIRKPRIASGKRENVSWLHVAMEDASCVKVIDPGGDWVEVPSQLVAPDVADALVKTAICQLPNGGSVMEFALVVLNGHQEV